ncbi:DUF6159 family protein [Halapricum hydrolyticum]|uniref:DUF6159 family protein n=1 Tax=Halapricum hydrolyticum TaxID=2979991 RepID=A0AAE3IE60_9EURY|nr:DUF6159 family protein [Halapricum hydrolyticum]MCU4719268.1 DUF6159 family protein [Halapricum hydrolyticum]MCU4728547.1 DUF6159 family protein [Halapricum hydrolyticum]
MARRSGRVLRTYPNLLILPLLGGIAGIAFVATLFGALYAGGVYDSGGVALYVALFAIYLVETLVASFFAAALVAATRAVFHGETPTVTDAMRQAWDHKWPLLVWSVIAAVVGVLIQAIESQDNIVAELLAGLFAVAWSVITYFVVPVIVFEDTSISGMFEESARTFKNTWGESIGAMGAINLVTFALVLVGALLGVVTFLVVPSGAGVAVAIVVGLSGIVLGLLIGKSLTGIAKTALYVYATEQTAPEFFEDMDFSKLGGDAGSQASRSGVGSRI